MPKGRRVENPEDVLPIASWTCRTRLYTQLPAGAESLQPNLVPFPGPSPSLWIPPKSWLLGFKSILESREICRSALRVSHGVQNFPLHLEKLKNPSTSFKKKHVLGIFSLKNVIPQTSPHTQTQKTSMYFNSSRYTKVYTPTFWPHQLLKQYILFLRLNLNFTSLLKEEGFYLVHTEEVGGGGFGRINCKTGFHKTVHKVECNCSGSVFQVT